MAVDGVGVGAGQNPRRTCFQPSCFRGGVGEIRQEGCAGETLSGTASGQRLCSAHRRRLRPSRSPAVPAPLPCSPFTPVRMLGFLQPGTVASRGPPGATGARLPDWGRAVWRPAAGARCLRQHQGQRRQQRCRSFVPPPARPRGTKTSAAVGAGTPASPLPAPAPSPHSPAWPGHGRRLHRSRVSGVSAAHAPAPAHVAPPPPPRHPSPCKLPRTPSAAAPHAPRSPAAALRLAPPPRPAHKARTPLRRCPPAPLCAALPTPCPYAAPSSPPLRRNLRTFLFAHPSCFSAHGSAAVPPRPLGHPPPRAPTLHMALPLPARGTDAAPLPPAHRAAAPRRAFSASRGAPQEEEPLPSGHS